MSDRSKQLPQLINDAWEHRASFDPATVDDEFIDTLDEILGLLESGALRVAEPDGQGGWQVNQWLKKAVLLYFRCHGNRVVAFSAWR